MTLNKRVEHLEKKVDNHEKRIIFIENKFDFIKNSLVSLKELFPKNIKKYKIIMWALSSFTLGMLIAILAKNFPIQIKIILGAL